MAQLGREEGANIGRGAKADAGPERLFPEQVADLLATLRTLPNLGIWRKPSGGPAGWLLRRRHGQQEGRRRSRSRRSRSRSSRSSKTRSELCLQKTDSFCLDRKRDDLMAVHRWVVDCSAIDWGN